jgi:hypothetical protein
MEKIPQEKNLPGKISPVWKNPPGTNRPHIISPMTTYH